MNVYHADPSFRGRLRRRLVRLADRRPAVRRPDRPIVTFAFDDTPASAVRRGAPILEQHGVRGTYYFCTGLAGELGHMGRYAGCDDMRRAAEAGHEIGCHTYSHLDCGQISGVMMADDIELNASLLSDWGVAQSIETFAYPYGDVGFAAKQAAAERFVLSRALHHGLIEPGADLNQAPAVGLEGEHGEAVGRAWLAKAAERRAWVILFTHGVEDAVSRFGTTADTLARLVDESLEMGFEVVSAVEGARRVGPEPLGAALFEAAA